MLKIRLLDVMLRRKSAETRCQSLIKMTAYMYSPAKMVRTTQDFMRSLFRKGIEFSVSTDRHTGKSMKPFRRVLVDANPSEDVARPTARLLGHGPTLEDLKSAPFRPHVLTDSINPPVTPHHEADVLGLFLYKNGDSSNPINVVVPRDRLCRSPLTLAATLGAEVDKEWGCEGRSSCRVFLHNGWEVSNCDELVDDDKLWLVPRHREFIWPTFKRGHQVEVRHVASGNGEPIIVETLSESPKVFRLNNFFTSQEADELIAHTLNLKDPVNGLHRSTTGQGASAQEDSHRTSENAWDLNSPASLRLKRRIFDLLGIRPYKNAWADGLQILRYNLTKAYNSHFDYLEHPKGSRMDSARPGGSNRFATVVVYLTDVAAGGETVFPAGKALDGTDKSYGEALKEMESQDIDLRAIGIKPGSWQERLVVECRSKLAVRPVKAQAVLFYNQLPEGGQDNASLHGGCPVLEGVKWAANLWVWNGNVHGDEHTSQVEEEDDGSLTVNFLSTNKGYSLYWEDTFFAALQPGVPKSMNTFDGHTFHIFEGTTEKEKGKLVATYVMKKRANRKDIPTYRFSPTDNSEDNEDFTDDEDDEWDSEEMSDDDDFSPEEGTDEL